MVTCHLDQPLPTTQLPPTTYSIKLLRYLTVKKWVDVASIYAIYCRPTELNCLLQQIL